MINLDKKNLSESNSTTHFNLAKYSVENTSNSKIPPSEESNFLKIQIEKYEQCFKNIKTNISLGLKINIDNIPDSFDEMIAYIDYLLRRVEHSEKLFIAMKGKFLMTQERFSETQKHLFRIQEEVSELKKKLI